VRIAYGNRCFFNTEGRRESEAFVLRSSSSKKPSFVQLEAFLLLLGQEGTASREDADHGVMKNQPPFILPIFSLT